MPGGSASWGLCHQGKDMWPGTPTPFCQGPFPLGVLAAHSVCTGDLRALLPADGRDQRQGLRGQGHPASPAHCGGHQGQGESWGDAESPWGVVTMPMGTPRSWPLHLLPAAGGFPSPSPRDPAGSLRLPGSHRCRWNGSGSCRAACATATSSACMGTSPTAATSTCCWSCAAAG